MDFTEVIQQKRNTQKTNQSSTNKPEAPSTDELIATAQKVVINDLDLPKRYRHKDFGNYDYTRLANDNPEKIFEAVKDFASNFIELWNENNWLILSGGCGVGKTHLAVGALKESARQRVAFKINKSRSSWFKNGSRLANSFIFKSSSAIIHEIKGSYNASDSSEYETLTRYMNCQLLVLDDLGTERASEWQQEKLHLLLNHRYNEMLPTIITTNLGINELNRQVGQRVVDRIIEAASHGDNLWRLKGKSNRRAAI